VSRGTGVDSGFAFQIILYALGAAALVAIVCIAAPAKFRHHARARHRRGRRTACFGCVRLVPVERDHTVERCCVPADGPFFWTLCAREGSHLHWLVAVPRKERSSSQSQIEQQIDVLPVSEWDGRVEVECSLCMESLQLGERLRRLPCAHAFHDGCIKHWLIDGQKDRNERSCPLCRAVVLQIAPTIDGPASGVVAQPVQRADDGDDMDFPWTF